MELPYSSDMLDLLVIFNRLKVQYLIVGGRAVNAYTEPRGTKDLDLWVNPTKANAKRVFAALNEFGAPLHGATEESFTRTDEFLFIGVAPNRVDVLKDIPGVEFDACWKKRRLLDLGKGLKANYIGLQDLITSKLASGRHIDLADTEKLQVALEQQQKQSLEQDKKQEQKPEQKRRRRHGQDL